jgi:hypothetical protein
MLPRDQSVGTTGHRYFGTRRRGRRLKPACSRRTSGAPGSCTRLPSWATIALLVEPGDALGQLCHYIHLNAVRAGIVTVERLGAYRHGSYWHLRNPKARPAFLHGHPIWLLPRRLAPQTSEQPNNCSIPSTPSRVSPPRPFRRDDRSTRAHQGPHACNPSRCHGWFGKHDQQSAFERSKAQLRYNLNLTSNTQLLSLKKQPDAQEDRTYRIFPGIDFDYTLPVNKDFGIVVTGQHHILSNLHVRQRGQV